MASEPYINQYNLEEKFKELSASKASKIPIQAWKDFFAKEEITFADNDYFYDNFLYLLKTNATVVDLSYYIWTFQEGDNHYPLANLTVYVRDFITCYYMEGYQC